jgi:hypothetical protein
MLLSIGARADAGGYGDILERAIPFVAVEVVRIGVVRDENVR